MLSKVNVVMPGSFAGAVDRTVVVGAGAVTVTMLADVAEEEEEENEDVEEDAEEEEVGSSLSASAAPRMPSRADSVSVSSEVGDAVDFKDVVALDVVLGVVEGVMEVVRVMVVLWSIV